MASYHFSCLDAVGPHDDQYLKVSALLQEALERLDLHASVEAQMRQGRERRKIETYLRAESGSIDIVEYIHMCHRAENRETEVDGGVLVEQIFQTTAPSTDPTHFLGHGEQ
jgi:hypothetical protein